MKKIIVLSSFIFLIGIQISNAQKGKEIIFGLGGAITSTWIIYQNFLILIILVELPKAKLAVLPGKVCLCIIVANMKVILRLRVGGQKIGVELIQVLHRYLFGEDPIAVISTGLIKV